MECGEDGKNEDCYLPSAGLWLSQIKALLRELFTSIPSYRGNLHAELHHATDDKVLEGASTPARGVPHSASEQEWSSHVREEMLHVSEHVSRQSWVICSARELRHCTR